MESFGHLFHTRSAPVGVQAVCVAVKAKKQLLI
jgi:hypothetical protein